MVDSHYRQYAIIINNITIDGIFRVFYILRWKDLLRHAKYERKTFQSSTYICGPLYAAKENKTKN